MNPDTTLFDEDENGNLAPYTPQLTATQAYLWKCFLEDAAGAIELAGNDPIHALYLGDPTQGIRFREDLVSPRMADQIIIATGNLMQFCQATLAQSLHMVVGTSVHEMGGESATILIAEQLKARLPVKVANHSLLNVAGVTVDAAHHGPGPGIRLWTRGNIARYYLNDLMLKSLIEWEEPPDLVLRGHYHEFIIEQNTINTRKRDYRSTICIMPSYCFVDAYIRKATRSTHLHDIGLAAFEIVGGKIVQVHKFSRRLDLRTREIIV